MGKSKKTKKTTKKSKKSKKKGKRRGRPPGSTKSRLSSVKKSIEDNNLNDYDSLLLQQLKNNRKTKVKEDFEDEYELDYEEEDAEEFIEGYDIELPEGEGLEDDFYNMGKKNRKKKRKNFLDELGIESEYYESDYNIGDYE